MGKEILTGFEFYALNFDYDIALSDLNDGLRAANPPNALQKLTGKKYEPKTFFADGQSIDARLRECERSVEINRYKETEELIGIAFASIVADLGDGVFHNGDTGEYLFGKDAVARIPELIRNLPSGLDWDLFESWPE